MKKIALAAAALAAFATQASAYTAAGDRLFPATILMPQIGPSDDLYVTGSTQSPGGGSRFSNSSVVYNKTITERFSVGVEDGWNRFDQAGGAGTQSGFQNLETTFKYLAILDPDHEFLLSVGADREWGGTGALGIGAAPSGATQPQIFFGKGLGEVGAAWLRPVAITGAVGYQFADTNTRPDLLIANLGIEYSIPYLASKVSTVALPDFVRSLTPIVEFQMATPVSATRGAKTQMMVAPGVNYAGEGWEVGVEALVPTTRAAGTGLGFIAQLHFSLDFLFPETLGRPIFARH